METQWFRVCILEVTHRTLPELGGRKTPWEMVETSKDILENGSWETQRPRVLQFAFP